MYEVNDYVSYGAKGIFQIKDVLMKKGKSGQKEQWYVLYSLKDGIETSVTTPSSNEAIRKILSKEAIEKLIREIPSLETVWSENKTIRYQLFQGMLESGSIRKLAQLSKTISLVKEEKEVCGKQLAEKDKEYLHRAERLMFEEISVSIHIKQDKVLDYVLHGAGII